MIRRPVKIVRRLSINLSNVFYFTALCFPRFLHLTEMRNERTPHSYFVRIFLIKLAGSSAFSHDTATQSPVRVWRACSKTNDVNGNSKIRAWGTREAPRNVWEMIMSSSMTISHLLKIRCWLGLRSPRSARWISRNIPHICFWFKKVRTLGLWQPVHPDISSKTIRGSKIQLENPRLRRMQESKIMRNRLDSFSLMSLSDISCRKWGIKRLFNTHDLNAFTFLSSHWVRRKENKRIDTRVFALTFILFCFFHVSFNETMERWKRLAQNIRRTWTGVARLLSAKDPDSNPPRTYQILFDRHLSEGKSSTVHFPWRTNNFIRNRRPG